MLSNCLRSISTQNIDAIEVIIVDNMSTDNTRTLAKQHSAKVITVGPQVGNFFAAPIQRRMGADEATGEHLYFVDSDMILLPGLLEECLSASAKYEALVVPEQSVGSGTWARAKIAEREWNVGDSSLEAPRFVSKSIYEKVGGWPQEAGSFDDWVFRDRLVARGVVIGRTQNFVLHNEGALRLTRLLRRKLVMGMSTNYVPQMSSERKFRRMSPTRLVSLLSGLSSRRSDVLFTFLFMKTLEGLFFYEGRLIARNRQVPDKLWRIHD
jgi:glycosyltransferase involved in cell wall biosynthesis